MAAKRKSRESRVVEHHRARLQMTTWMRKKACRKRGLQHPIRARVAREDAKTRTSGRVRACTHAPIPPTPPDSLAQNAVPNLSESFAGLRVPG